MTFELLDVAARGAVTGVALIFVGILWINLAPREARIALTLAILSSLCRTWSTLPPGIELPQEILFGLKYLGATVVVFFTWGFIALFIDDHRFFWGWIGSSAVALLGLWAIPLFPGLSGVTRVAVLVHVAALMTAIVLPHRDDLVDRRRNARIWAAVSVMAYVIFSASFSSPMLAAQPPVAVTLTQSIAQLLAFAMFTLWTVTLDPHSWVRATPAPDAQAAAVAPGEAAQAQLMRRIEAAMQREIWRREGLTVSDLAQEVGAPDHQVRKAINHSLGHRNFSSFINQARITHAKEQLSAAGQPGKSVQEIAYDAGFSSIGPFNRAFRELTGSSPTAFRQAQLAKGLADSE